MRVCACEGHGYALNAMANDWSQLLAGAVGSKEEPMLEQGLWGTCVLMQDPHWRRFSLEDWTPWKGPVLEK